MATRLKEVDAVMVGMGWTGAILARALTRSGLNVVGLERGADRNPAEQFTLTRLRDELRYVVRLELMQDNSIDTITFRNAPATNPLRTELMMQGEIVAIVAAETEDQAEDAVEAIAVEYADLPSIGSIAQAMTQPPRMPP